LGKKFKNILTATAIITKMDSCLRRNDKEGQQQQQQQQGKNYTLMLLLLVWKNSTRGCGEFPVG